MPPADLYEGGIRNLTEKGGRGMSTGHEWKITLTWNMNEGNGPERTTVITKDGGWASEKGGASVSWCFGYQLAYLARMILASGDVIGGGNEVDMVKAFTDGLGGDTPPFRIGQSGRPIGTLPLSTRAKHGLLRRGVGDKELRTVGELCEQTAEHLLDRRNLGEISLAEIVKVLDDMGLYLSG